MRTVLLGGQLLSKRELAVLMGWLEQQVRCALALAPCALGPLACALRARLATAACLYCSSTP